MRNTDGHPIAGAVVQAEPDSPGATQSRPETSRADGRFEIVGLGPGVYRLVARDRDFAPRSERPVHDRKRRGF